MANTKILLFSKANKLGIEGFRQMDEDTLKEAIAAAEKGDKPAKGKTAPVKGKTAPAKGKTTTTTAKGKTTPAKGKSSPSKSAPAKGKSTVKASPAKSTAKKTTAAKPKASQGAQAKRTPARGKTATGAARIDNKSVDWKAESTVGLSGKRKEVLDALRKRKGDKAKVYDDLAANAKKYYPGKTKHEAETTLVWLIGRVAFDFVMNTGQHTPGKRAAHGTSDAPQDVRRRELREQARKDAAKAERAARRGGAGTTRSKTKTAAKSKGKTKGKR